MEGYLGETVVEQAKTPFLGYTPAKWALAFISRYGQIDGEHHKTWVLDQVARILKGTKVIISLARWENGTEEYRFRLGDPSEQYLSWKHMMIYEGQSEPQYDYDEGIVP